MDHQHPDESLGRVVDLSKQHEMADISGIISISETHNTFLGGGADQGATEQVRLEDEQSEYNRNEYSATQGDFHVNPQASERRNEREQEGHSTMLNATANFETANDVTLNPGKQAKEPLHQFETSSEHQGGQQGSPRVQDLQDRVAKKAKARLQHQAASLQEVYSNKPNTRKRHVITEASEVQEKESTPTILEEVLRTSAASLHKNAPTSYIHKTPAVKKSSKQLASATNKSEKSPRKELALDLKKSENGSIKVGSEKPEVFASSNTPEWLYKDRLATREDVEALLRLGDNVTETVLADALLKLKTDMERIEGGAVSPLESPSKRSPRATQFASTIQVEQVEELEKNLRKELEGVLHMQSDMAAVADEDRETILRNTKEIDRLRAKVTEDKKLTEKNGGVKLQTPQEKSIKAKVTELKNKNNELVQKRSELMGHLALDAEGELSLTDAAYLGYREQLNSIAKHNSLAETFAKKVAVLENQIETKSKGLEYVEGNIMRDRHYILEKLQEKRVALQATEKELNELFKSVKAQEEDKIRALNKVPEVDPLAFERNPEGKQYQFEVPGSGKGKVFDEDMSQFLDESRVSFPRKAGDFHVTFGSPAEKSFEDLLKKSGSDTKKGGPKKPNSSANKSKPSAPKQASAVASAPQNAASFSKNKGAKQSALAAAK